MRDFKCKLNSLTHFLSDPAADLYNFLWCGAVLAPSDRSLSTHSKCNRIAVSLHLYVLLPGGDPVCGQCAIVLAHSTV